MNIATYCCHDCGAVHRMREQGPCPACGTGAVSACAAPDGAPERYLPRQVDRAEAVARLGRYLEPVWFPVEELDAERLGQRLVPVWWPRWLVDVDAQGAWQAEAGYDEPIESSQEVYRGGRWTTRKVMESRTRWEPRAGRVRRRYDNVEVPALQVEREAEPVDPAATEPWSEAACDGAVRLPDRSPADQWPAAVEEVRKKVGEDCQRATGADHVRELYLDLSAEQADWSVLLKPAWITWYRDEQGQTHVLRVDGATGEVCGPRLASEAAGRRWARVCYLSGLLVGLLGLVLGLVGLVLWVLLPLAGALLLLGALVGLAGSWPHLQPGRWNQTQLRSAGAG
jgi:hypothetical protein